MAALTKLPHLLTIGGKTYTMILPDEYQSATSEVGVKLGITKVTGALPTGTERLTLKEGLANGLIFHVAVSYNAGTTDAPKRKRRKLVCGRDNIAGGLSLAGTQFSGFPITSAVIPQHLTFS
ncbi:hypothetical protein [uncultured Nostoc sp.]|uniref:hypothetical protein n=1 Tax=uncultured Nostoc sp. TaxID=340711 RepID=UPI0035CA9133